MKTSTDLRREGAKNGLKYLSNEIQAASILLHNGFEFIPRDKIFIESFYSEYVETRQETSYDLDQESQDLSSRREGIWFVEPGSQNDSELGNLSVHTALV